MLVGFFSLTQLEPVWAYGKEVHGKGKEEGACPVLSAAEIRSTKQWANGSGHKQEKLLEQSMEEYKNIIMETFVAKKWQSIKFNSQLDI